MKDFSEYSRLPSEDWVYENLKNKIYMYVKLMNFRTIVLFLGMELMRSIYLIIKFPERFHPIKNAIFWNLRNFKIMSGFLNILR